MSKHDKGLRDMINEISSKSDVTLFTAQLKKTQEKGKENMLKRILMLRHTNEKYKVNSTVRFDINQNINQMYLNQNNNLK